MKFILNFAKENQGIVMTLCTVALAVITGVYLTETKKIRKIASDSYLTDTAPIIFLELPAPLRKIDLQNHSLLIIPQGIVKNMGKTVAKNLDIEYSLRKGSLKLTKKLLTTPYIYPTQQFFLDTESIVASLNDLIFLQVKGVIERKEELIFSKNFGEQWFFDATLKYFDAQNELKVFQYTFVYYWDKNVWGIVPPGTEKVEL